MPLPMESGTLQPAEKDSDEKFKRKVAPKPWMPSERTSTMSFKAPMSEEKKLALLKAKEPPPPTGLVGYITGPVKFIASAFTGSSSPKPEHVTAKSEASSKPKPYPKMKEVANVIPDGQLDDETRSPSSLNLAESEEYLNPSHPPVQYMIESFRPDPPDIRDKLEAKKLEALNNLKHALKSRQTRNEWPQESPKIPDLLPSATQITTNKPKNPQSVKIHNTKKYAYSITSSPPTEEDLPPAKAPRDPNKKQPPKPIRVTSGASSDPNENTIKVKKSDAPIDRSSAWSSPRFKKKGPQLVSHSVMGVNSQEIIHEPSFPEYDRPPLSNRKGIQPMLAHNVLLGKKPNRSRPHPTLSEMANKSNSATCIERPLGDCDDAVHDIYGSLEEPNMDCLSFQSHIDGGNQGEIKVGSLKEFNSSNNIDLGNKEGTARNTSPAKPQRDPAAQLEKSQSPPKPSITPNDTVIYTPPTAQPIIASVDKQHGDTALDKSLSAPPPAQVSSLSQDTNLSSLLPSMKRNPSVELMNNPSYSPLRESEGSPYSKQRSTKRPVRVANRSPSPATNHTSPMSKSEASKSPKALASQVGKTFSPKQNSNSNSPSASPRTSKKKVPKLMSPPQLGLYSGKKAPSSPASKKPVMITESLARSKYDKVNIVVKRSPKVTKDNRSDLLTNKTGANKIQKVGKVDTGPKQEVRSTSPKAPIEDNPNKNEVSKVAGFFGGKGAADEAKNKKVVKEYEKEVEYPIGPPRVSPQKRLISSKPPDEHHEKPKKTNVIDEPKKETNVIDEPKRQGPNKSSMPSAAAFWTAATTAVATAFSKAVSSDKTPSAPAPQLEHAAAPDEKKEEAETADDGEALIRKKIIVPPPEPERIQPYMKMAPKPASEFSIEEPPVLDEVQNETPNYALEATAMGEFP